MLADSADTFWCGATTGEPPCELLPWDTEFFGVVIARVRRVPQSGRDLAEIDAWCAAHQVDCLKLLVDASQPGIGHLATRGGFEFIDIRLELELSLGRNRKVICMDHALPACDVDLPAAIAIASQVHVDSRFQRDPRFAPHGPALFAAWIRRDFKRDMGDLLVAKRDGRVVGYCSCFVEDPHRCIGRISLVGVDPQATGQGFGRRLTQSALAWCRERGCSRVQVVTQGSNIAAQRLYQSIGFQSLRCQLWFHRWRSR